MTSFAESSFLAHVVGKDLKPVEANHFENKIIGLYFSAHWCGPCRSFTPKLVEKYNEILQAGHAFDIIFISSDEDEDSAHEYYETMPWKMVRYEERDVESTLSAKYQVRGIPTLVLLNADGSLLSNDGRSVLFATPFEKLTTYVADQEAEAKRLLEEVQQLQAKFDYKTFFGDKEVIGKDGVKVDITTWSEDTIVGLYFSAHWCPPCRMFTPKLAEKYQALKDAGKPFEIIFLSLDRDEQSAKDYFASMPWHTLPFQERKTNNTLAEVFNVSGIPSLVLVDANGLITENGTEAIHKYDFENLRTFEENKKKEAEELARVIATMPDTVTISAHPHELQKLPSVYRGSYGCDACGAGGEGWVYHCDTCGFDMHPSCVLKSLKASEQN